MNGGICLPHSFRVMESQLLDFLVHNLART
jgi:hypothetical protein